MAARRTGDLADQALQLLPQSRRGPPLQPLYRECLDQACSLWVGAVVPAQLVEPHGVEDCAVGGGGASAIEREQSGGLEKQEGAVGGEAWVGNETLNDRQRRV